MYGGRVRRRNTDNIFQRLHSLTPPAPHDELPLTLVDNPSRDFVFPACTDRLVDCCRSLPAGADITHLWLRRQSHREFDRGVPFAEFVCGGGVRLVVIYPWPADLLLWLGPRRPKESKLREFQPWTDDLRCVDGNWCLAWPAEALERFYIEQVMPHEVGHAADRHHVSESKASRRRSEDRAESYAVRWSAAGVEQFS